MTVPTVHVVDDDEPLRTALARLLRTKGYEVRTYASAGDFLITPPAGGQGCLILDLRMPGPSGLALQEALDRYAVTLPIVFLTGHGDVASSVRAMKAGAVDFLTKPVEPDVLLQAVAVALGRDGELRASRADLAIAKARWATLTERERDVFDRVVAGTLNKVIAADLGITERTVKAHRHEVMAKMGAGSLAELVDMGHLLRGSSALSRPPDSIA
jgi:FixJ family two-component response regulator